jgi:hypothetical protein
MPEGRNILCPKTNSVTTLEGFVLGLITIQKSNFTEGLGIT